MQGLTSRKLLLTFLPILFTDVSKPRPIILNTKTTLHPAKDANTGLLKSNAATIFLNFFSTTVKLCNLKIVQSCQMISMVYILKYKYLRVYFQHSKLLPEKAVKRGDM